jgi:dolichol-phosphate mannosyltransferase
MISIITTAYNEEKNIAPLYMKIREAMEGLDYEIVAVNDGSTDGTPRELERIRDKRLRTISLGERKGKCFALYEGLKACKGDIVATLDADLQDDPQDIPKMLEKLDDCDCICGWRYMRMDGPVKRVSSRVGNLALNALLDSGLHDNVCPLKVFRKECVSRVKYFRNFHRFIPVMAKIQGFRIMECRVRHHPRIYGASKYGIRNRLLGNLKTILVIKFRYRSLLWS